MLTTILALLNLGPTLAAVDLTTQVRCAEIAFSQSAERRGRKAFAGFLNDDVRMVAREILRGPDAVLEDWANYFRPDGPRISWRPKTVEVNAAGNLAFSRGPYRLIRRNDQGLEEERWGTFISVWRLHPDGRWRVQFDTGANHGMEPSAEERALIEQTKPCAASQATS